jgi:hypothetical protein
MRNIASGPMSSTKCLLAAAGAVVACGIPSAQAAHPLATEDAATLGGAGLLEVEIAGGLGASPGVAGSVAGDLGAALHAGLASWLDLGVAFNLGLTPGQAGGTLAPMVDAKFRLVEAGERRPGLALRLEYGVEEEWAAHQTSHGAAVQLALTFEGRILDLHLNVLGGLGGNIASPPEMALGAASAVVFHLGEHADLGLELILDADPVATAGSVGGSVGIAVNLPADLVLSVGLGLGWAAGGGVVVAPTLGLTIPIDPLG